MSLAMYGIPNCDTVKKARTWLEGRGIKYAFHDYKKEGADPAKLAAWAGQAGWEKVLNRAGTTFRKLPETDKTGLTAAKAVALMLAQPSMIKRPILDIDGRLLAGFKPDIYEAAFAA